MDDPERAARQQQLYLEAVGAFGSALERLAHGYESLADARQDLLQEIHVALWRSFSNFKGQCSLRTWIYRVAHNTAIAKVLRARTHQPAFVTLDELGESQPAARDDDRTLDRQRALERLHGLIQGLRPLDRQVILLYLEQEDATSIAEITGLTSANVATKIHRIKQVLIRQFHAGADHGK